ncbi:oxidoreductase [Thalassotalea insulae]|uniref:Oxidoreductase n=1 Tax=Thalassotalea insulae TaxID=2056778 RepID=A0ABQ6GRD5_9GAMM|nr:YCF48-related protein [Thalassotalea insulae]GLX77754.1 oxidoreductase [Thalassotalea insulae]
MLKKISAYLKVLISYSCGLLSLLLLAIQVNATTMAQLPSWQHQQMEGVPSLRGSAIINDSLWVTGSNNSVFVSQDGGHSWHNKSVPHSIVTDFRDIELFDKNTAIVMGVGNGKQSMLFKTTDGGDNWQLLYQNTAEQGFFDSIAFWDKSTGLLMGDPVDGYYVVKKTEDGGKTWRRIARNKLPKLLEKEAAFAASGNTLIVGKNGQAWLTTGGFLASVYQSNDYGETWQRSTVPLLDTTQTAGGYGLGLNHQQQPFVVGGDYQQRPSRYANMATFVDGQWQKVNTGDRGLRTAFSCQGVICITTGKTNNDISYNGGKSWQMLKHTTTTEDKGFYTLASDNFRFLFAGANGQVAILDFRSK